MSVLCKQAEFTFRKQVDCFSLLAQFVSSKLSLSRLQVIIRLEDLLDASVRKQQQKEAEMQLVAPDLQVAVLLASRLLFWCSIISTAL